MIEAQLRQPSRDATSLVDRSKTARKFGGPAEIRKLQLFDTRMSMSKLVVSYKTARELKRDKAAFAVMKHTIALAAPYDWSDGLARYAENNARNAHHKIYHYDYSKKIYVGDRKKAEAALQKESPIAWVRTEYVRLFSKYMKEGKFESALELVSELNIHDHGRLEKAAEALFSKLMENGEIEKAKEIRAKFLWEKDLRAEFKARYNDDESWQCEGTIVDFTDAFGGSDGKTYSILPLHGKKILDIACGAERTHDGTSTGSFSPRFCRALMFFGASPVGIDIESNRNEHFESHQMDLVYGNINIFQKGSFDGINCKMFISLSTRSEMHNMGRKNTLELKPLHIDGGPFYVGFGDGTSPGLRTRFDWAYGRQEYFDIVKGIFDSALELLKDGGVMIFDHKLFVKRGSALEYKGITYELKSPKKSKEYVRRSFFVPESSE